MQDGPRFLTETDLMTLTTSKQTAYGALGLTGDGREFRYVSFGGTTTIQPGLILEAAVTKANAQALAIPAAGTGGQVTANLAAGSTTLVLTNSSTAVTQDEFAEGTLDISQTSGTNEGPISYKVKGNSAAAAATGYIQVYLAEPLRNAEVLVAATDTGGLWTSRYQAPIITTTRNVAVGATIQQVVNSATVTNYGWVQTKGRCVLQGDASSKVIGNTIGASTTSAGYVSLAVTTTQPPIGWSQTTATTGLNAVVLNML